MFESGSKDRKKNGKSLALGQADLQRFVGSTEPGSSEPSSSKPGPLQVTRGQSHLSFDLKSKRGDGHSAEGVATVRQL